MKELFETYNRQALRLGLKMELYHSSIIDWRITIEKKETRKKKASVIVDVQHCDYEYVLAKAQVDLKEWLSKNDGGY